MEKLRAALAYLASFIVFFVAIVLAIIWMLLYGGAEGIPGNGPTIDLAMFLAMKIIPTIASVGLSSYVFSLIYPNIPSKYIATVVNFSLMIAFYFTTIANNMMNKDYGNYIYTISGIITSIVFLSNFIKSQHEIKNTESSTNIADLSRPYQND